MEGLRDGALLRHQLFIDGEWHDAGSGKTLDVLDPASGQSLGTVPDAGVDETRRAITAAHAAFQTFSQTLAVDRASMLRRLHGLLLEHQDDLALILTREQGKPLAEGRAEIGMSAAYVLWFAEEARRVYGDIIPSPWKGRQLLSARMPIGVVAAITPWNFPSSMLARKIAPALAAGCTIVAKPATQTPLSALAWAELCNRAGFPPGVINVLTGDARSIGGEMTANPLVRKLTFTGSTAVGRALLGQAAATIKKVSMELGGNAPFIVFDDADLDRAVEGALDSKFRNSGQTCVCTNRFYVQAGIHDAFVARLAERCATLLVGPGTEPGVQQGPLIDAAAIERVEELVADAVAAGAVVETGGRRHERGGLFFEPTVMSGADSAMRVAHEEIFGPVAPVFRFTTEEEVVALANDTEFGLAAYFYTRDLARAFRVSNALEYGIVGVNEGLVTTEVAPFGGFKQSGLGREGGSAGIEDYFETKYVCLGGLEQVA